MMRLTMTPSSKVSDGLLAGGEVVDEVAHLLREAVSAGLFGHRIDPAGLCVGLLDRVADGVLDEAPDRADRGVGDEAALRADELVPKLHAALLDPRRLDGGHLAAREFEQRDRGVFAGGLVAVHHAWRPTPDLGDRVVLAEEVPRRFDGVAAHVEQRAAAGGLGVPEVRCVRTGMTLAGAHGEQLADAAGLDHLVGLGDVGREHRALGIAVPDAGFVGRIEDLLRLVFRARRAAWCR